MSYFILVVYLLINSCVGECEDNSTRRIVGGKDANIEDFPYQIQLVTRGFGRNKLFCGGSIIGKSLVLTAAHCILEPKKVGVQYFVRAGTASRLGEDGSEHMVVRDLAHPAYATSDEHDIALVLVYPPFQYDTRRRPIELADKPLTTGINGNVTGWGYIDSKMNIMKDQLQVGHFMASTYEDCLKASAWDKDVLFQTNFCASHLNSDTCSGDSGGPFVSDGKLYGVVSRGYKFSCYAKAYPSIFTDAEKLKKWIFQTAKRFANKLP